MAINYNRITDLVLKAMEDEPTWRKTWTSQAGGNRNFITGHVYRGVNQITTSIAMMLNGWEAPFWLSAKQCIDMGVSFKGMTATPVLYFHKGVDKTDPEKVFMMSKITNMFNTDQLGIDYPKQDLRETKLENPHEMAEALQLNVQSSESFGPCYVPSLDVIRMPLIEQFETDDAYQSTFYHECIHATGHKKRLDRDMSGTFGSEDYAREELVAELGAIFLCNELGVSYEIDQHASYLNSWKKAIKDDPKYFVTAATNARKANEYCMSQFEMMRKYEAA